jgi:ribosomal protein S27AE
MPDYSKGKIYAIRSHQTDDIYIGGTTQKLYMRLAGHNRHYKNWINGKSKVYYTSYEIMKYDDAYIELLELCPCNSKMELDKREGQLIREMICINKRISGRTSKEYYQENKEKILKRSKQHYEKNKEKTTTQNYYKEKRKEYYEKNRDKMIENMRQYALNNKEKERKRKQKYYEDNKEKIKQKRDKLITCKCGSVVTKHHVKRHERSKKHQTYIQSQSN